MNKQQALQGARPAAGTSCALQGAGASVPDGALLLDVCCCRSLQNEFLSEYLCNVKSPFHTLSGPHALNPVSSTGVLR